MTLFAMLRAEMGSFGSLPAYKASLQHAQQQDEEEERAGSSPPATGTPP